MSASGSHLVRRAPPTPRAGVYELYWEFASKRQAAFEARLAGRGWPWSPDPILQTFKFCNVFRASDRVSPYLRGSSEPIELFFPPKWKLSSPAALPAAKVAALNAAPASRYEFSKNAALQKNPGMRDLFDPGRD